MLYKYMFLMRSKINVHKPRELPKSISDEDSLSEIALSGASKLASTYFTLFSRSVHVLYTGIHIFYR